MFYFSFYNWTKGSSSHSSSPYFDVVMSTDSMKLLFVCKGDGYAIDVNPKTLSTEKVDRLDFIDTDYGQVVIFDHVVDRPVP
ncbi:hypothetical protein CDAR_377481 [Caerostris darwini]|uniref:Cilia- and flagella-associated protein 299 n=1 Tax=Caerostris darwini TaxID=1538125 RepID=A0AAV4W1M5_9ARAC|nr:hypothetical protein CDAR_377481 [Caerostris darwini]